MVFILSSRFSSFSLCFFLFILFSACENDENEVANMVSAKLGIEEAKSVAINYTVGGKTRTILRAPLMLNVKDSIPYVEFPNSIQADFFNPEGVVESVLSAGYGRYRESQSVIFIRDSVVVINKLKGDTLYCKELVWDRKKAGREFYTDKPVRIRTRTQVIDGVGMESDQDFRDWQILHPSGTVDVPSSRFPD